MLMKKGDFLMQKYSIIPASLTTNIKHGTCSLTDDGKAEISFDIYKNPDTDLVYKACACSIHNSFSPINLGTVMTVNNTCHLSCTAPFDAENSVIVIYLKDTRTSTITYEGYCVLNDKPVIDINVSESDTGMFDIECIFEQPTEDIAPDEEFDSIDNAEKVLEDYKELHPPSDISLGINKKYFDRILSELESFKPFLWNETAFNWYKIDAFTIPGNLSSIKYVLFDTLAINSFDANKHYLIGIKDSSEDDESFYIAIALPSSTNPLSHLNGYTKKIPYNESYDYYTAYIELAPDGQYFLCIDSEI